MTIDSKIEVAERLLRLLKATAEQQEIIDQILAGKLPAITESRPELKGNGIDETKLPEQRMAFSKRETAEILGLSVISVHRLTKRGLLRASKSLRKPIYSRQELERFLAETSQSIQL